MGILTSRSRRRDCQLAQLSRQTRLYPGRRHGVVAVGGVKLSCCECSRFATGVAGEVWRSNWTKRVLKCSSAFALRPRRHRRVSRGGAPQTTPLLPASRRLRAATRPVDKLTRWFLL